MNENKNEIAIPETDLFSSKEEFSQYMLLKCLAQSDEPLGSWVLKVMLELQGIELGTATIGRYLKSLDSKKYTKLVGTKGRVITSEGLAYLSHISDEIEREQLQKKLTDAAQPQNFNELIDLLRARKALECESARLAAIRATKKDLEAIEKSMEKHESFVKRKNDPTSPALDFHRKVTLASQNKFLIAALDILIFEEVKLESQITDLIVRERGEEYALQHRVIAEAIKQKDSLEAYRQMKIHIETLINDISKQSNELR